jgi:hypothetical protein
MLDKIAKLLKQAERAGTEEEAMVFTEKAQKLAATYSIDLAMARAHTAKEEKRQVPVVQHVTIGERGKRYNKQLIVLMSAIVSAYPVKMDVAHNSTYVILYGFETDIELVKALYASLAVQMMDSGRRYLASGDYRGEQVWSESKWRMVPVHGTTARTSFNEGFARRVGQRLRERTAEAKAEATVTHVDTLQMELKGEQPDILRPEPKPVNNAALAIRATELEVNDFHKAKSNARGTWSGPRGLHVPSASSAGRDAGAKARIGGERAIGGSRAALR